MKHKGLEDCGLCPLDLLALAHGSCTAMMVAMKANAEGINADDMEVEVTQDYSDGPPLMLKTVNICFRLPVKINNKQEAKLRQTAAMCPVHTSLGKHVAISMEFVCK